MCHNCAVSRLRRGLGIWFMRPANNNPPFCQCDCLLPRRIVQILLLYIITNIMKSHNNLRYLTRRRQSRLWGQSLEWGLGDGELEMDRGGRWGQGPIKGPSINQTKAAATAADVTEVYAVQKAINQNLKLIKIKFSFNPQPKTLTLTHSKYRHKNIVH